MNITNHVVTDYIRGFYKPLSPVLAKLRMEAEEEGVPIILEETESFLQFFMACHRPRRILEIGTAVGYSAMVFASLCERNSHLEDESLGEDKDNIMENMIEEISVVSIEKDPATAKRAMDNIREAGFEKICRVITGDGEEVINDLASKGEKHFDLVFIDAAKSHYERFFRALTPLCKEGTVIISDNVLLKGSTASDQYDPTGRFKTNIKNMRNYLDHITCDPKLDTAILACGDGLALSRYKE